MNTNFISSEVVIAKVYRDFKPGISNWIYDAVEWVGEVLHQTRCMPALAVQVKCLQVKEFKARIPCDIASLKGVEHEGNRLSSNRADDSEAMRTKGKLTDFPTYEITGPYMKFKFEEGEVFIYYMGIPCDDNGWPLVPDNEKMKKALAHRILLGLLSRGFKHPTVGGDYWDMETRVEMMIEDARNDINMPSIDDYERMKTLWNTHNQDSNLHRQFFNNSVRNLSLTDADEPGAKAENPYEIDTDAKTGF